MIDQTEVTSEITITEYVVYAACALSIDDLIVFALPATDLVMNHLSPFLFTFLQLLTSLARFAKIIPKQSSEKQREKHDRNRSEDKAENIVNSRKN